TAGKQYRLSGTSGPASGFTVVGPASISGTYVTQYAVTFNQSGIGGDTGAATVVTVAGTPHPSSELPFSTFVDSGAGVSYSYASPVVASGTKRYALTSTMPASLGSVTSPTSVTGTYKTQFLVTFDQSGLGADATGTIVTVDGSPQSTLPY